MSYYLDILLPNLFDHPSKGRTGNVLNLPAEGLKSLLRT